MSENRAFIYADNAATTPLAPEALEAMEPFLKEEYANASGLYSFSRKAKKAIQDARESIAACIGAKASEIYFTSGGTESDNWAVKGVAFQNWERRPHIVTSKIEHHAVLNSCKALERIGCTVDYLSPDSAGRISPQSLSDAITPNTVLASVMMANNEIGTIQDIASLSQQAHSQGIVFHTDAVQAVGHIPVDVDALGVDLLSASAHKFNGPKGIGFLYIRDGIELSPFLNGGQQERGRRAGTENVAGIVGMATALRFNVEQMDQTTAKLRRIEQTFIDALRSAIPNVVVNGDASNHLPGLVSLSITGASGEGLLHILDLKGCAVSTGAACNSLSTKISPSLLAIGVPESLSKGTLRVSFGRFNKVQDAQRIAELIAKFAKIQE
ncbi:MAG: cysteine desulfurase [Thermoguttaceae bacterium]|nr:cysteine desulfurase [Thermoguttaceae bacterium]